MMLPLPLLLASQSRETMARLARDPAVAVAAPAQCLSAVRVAAAQAAAVRMA